MPRRILFISPQPFFEWRGSPIRVAAGVEALAEAGYDVDLLTLPVGQPRETPGVRVIRVANPLRLRELKIGPSAAKLFFDGLLLLKGVTLCVRRRYDVIHGVEDAGAIAWVLASTTRTHLIVEKHSDPASYDARGLKRILMAAYAAVERFVVRRADGVIATGAGLAEQATAARKRPGVHHIPDLPSSRVTASPAKTADYRVAYQRAEGDLLAMYVGSFAVYQGVDLMFAAIPRVARNAPRVRFVIIGGGDEEVAARRDELAAAGCADAVLFAGTLAPDELQHALAAADMLLSPRLTGVNTPLKILDYMKAGGAIVATDTQANRLLLDETCAVLARSDAEAFADAIIRVANDEAAREAVMARGRERVERDYSFPVFKERLAACYRAVCGSAETS